MKNKKYTDDEIKCAVLNSNTMAGALRNLNLQPVGGNYKTIKKYIEQLKIDTTHWLGCGWAKGREFTKKNNINDILIENSFYSSSKLRNRIIKEKLLEDKCSICGINEWNNNKLTLHLDHINGNPRDNRVENLRLLCPNCHSQTNTYCGKNINTYNNFCIDCGKEINKRATRCPKCANIKTANQIEHKNKIEWPNIDVLIKMVKETSYRNVAKILGISDSAIRKRIMKLYGPL